MICPTLLLKDNYKGKWAWFECLGPTCKIGVSVAQLVSTFIC